MKQTHSISLLKLIPILLIGIFLTMSSQAQVIINEINYRSEDPAANMDHVDMEFIELYNQGSSSVDLSNWFIDDGISFKFPNGTSIGASSYLIIASNVSDFNSSFPSNNAPVVGGWTGSLRNSGEDIFLRDASFNEIDFVDYDNWNEWPSTGNRLLTASPATFDEDISWSLQKVNFALPGNHAGSWDAANPTPGALNGSVFDNNPAQRPIIQNVRRSPDKPLSTESVRVRAEFDQDNLVNINGLSVVLEYRVLKPGSYRTRTSPNYGNNWTSLTMRDDGIGADSTANNGVFTAEIPASQHAHRDLVRYRIKVTNNAGFNETYPDQNYRESNYAYYVYNGYPSHEGINLTALPELQDLTLVTNATITDIYIGDAQPDGTSSQNDNQYQGSDELGEGTIVYNGRVYDHVTFRPRGRGSRRERNKPGIKFDMNREHTFETENDCGNTYDVDRGSLILSGGWVNDPSSHGLTESLIYKIHDLVGGLKRAVNYTHFRIVDETNELGDTGDFWGLYLIMEDYNGDLLDEHNYGEGNFWDNNAQRDRELDHQGDFPGSGTVGTYVPFDIGGNPTNAYIGLGTGPTDLFFDDRIANVIYAQHGNNYIGKHSYKEYYDADTGTRLGWWGDMDNSFGAASNGSVECPDAPIQCEDYLVFPRTLCNPLRHVDNHLIVDISDRIEYQNRMRSVYDLLMNGDHDNSSSVDPWEQIDFLVDREVEKVYVAGGADDWMEADQKRWGQTYETGNIANQIQWYKDWFHTRAGYMANNSSGSNPSDANNGTQVFIDVDDDVRDTQIPDVPTINKTGAGFAVDELTFSNSSFSDPQGNNTFGALEWRIAEWSDPTNPFYDTRCTPHYEIEAEWESGEILTNSTSITIPSNGIRAGRTYKVRMRHKDNTGRWSHWSDAVKFIAEPPANPVADVITITELHYNPSNGCAEFVEIYNNSNSTVNLTGYRFSDGIDFDFPNVNILPGEYKIIIDDQTCFTATFGNSHNSSIIGEYSGALNNGGEEVKLQIGDTRLDSVKYDDDLPWDTIADNGLHSLALIDINLDNNIAVNWSTQCVSVTPGAPNDFSGCVLPIDDLSSIVINEIAYNPKNNFGAADTSLEFIELKNTGSVAVDIQGVVINAINHQVLDSHIIPPGGFAVLAKDTLAFKAFYGIDATDQYSGSLSNGGEPIQVFDFFNTYVDNVTYDENVPWDITAKNGTHSLALIDSNFDNDSPVNWSQQRTNFEYTPMAENVFDGTQFPDYTGLEINEIHFQPGNFKLEFIELKNNGNIPIFLGDVRFQGVNFTFVDTDIIFPNNYVVVARNFSDFVSFYGVTPNGSYVSGALNNTGENLLLIDLFGNTIDQVNYSNSSPWDTGTNDNEHSLALRPGGLNNALASSWSIQCDLYTPNAANNFDDDNDAVCNNADACPNFDDTLIGTACNDGDPCTTGETYNNSCGCSGGVFQDSDGDGVCDSQDQCPNMNDGLIGSSCDDGDGCTVGETYDSNCDCSGGVFIDSDGDNVCDVNDVCPNFNDNLIGASCNDNDPCTINDKFTTNCLCEGTPAPDSDGDGVCDPLDVCSNLDDSLLGATCDDGILCFIGSTYQVINGTTCGCTGGFFSDVDNDNVCDPLDQCPGGDDNVDLNGNGTPDACENCQDYIVENSQSLIHSDRSANISIETNGFVPPSNDITYQGGQSVEFKENFQVQLGAVFEAKIDVCN